MFIKPFTASRGVAEGRRRSAIRLPIPTTGPRDTPDIAANLMVNRMNQPRGRVNAAIRAGVRGCDRMPARRDEPNPVRIEAVVSLS